MQHREIRLYRKGRCYIQETLPSATYQPVVDK